MDDECDDDSQSVASSSNRSFAEYSNCSSKNMSHTIERIYNLLAHDNVVTSKQHVDAAILLQRTHNALIDGASLGRASQTMLLCVVSSLHRRIVRMENDAFFAVDEHVRQELNIGREEFARTATLVFVVIATGDMVARGSTQIDGDAAQRELDECTQRALWVELCKPPSKKRPAEEPETVVEGEEPDPAVLERMRIEQLVGRPMLAEETSSGWRRMLYEPGTTAGAAVRLASSLLAEAFDERPFRGLMATFARSSAQQMCVQMLRSTNDCDFLTLSARAVAVVASDDRDDALMTLVQAGESEMGQQVLRDLMLSFLLPKSVVGVRRTLALTREASTAATAAFPFITEIAHQTAMQGCEYVWKYSECELKRMCALLAGIAMLTTRGTDDLVRKATAFSGLFQLPFLETITPIPRRYRIALVPTTRSWVLYNISAKGTPHVQLSKRGFDGLLFAVLAFRERGMLLN